MGYDGRICTGFVFVWIEAVAVNDDVLRTETESVKSSVHGKDAGAKDVYLVYLFSCDYAKSPSDGIAFYLCAEVIALFGGELFRIVEKGIGIVWRENDCRSINAACKAASTGFIAASFNKRWGMEG